MEFIKIYNFHFIKIRLLYAYVIFQQAHVYIMDTHERLAGNSNLFFPSLINKTGNCLDFALKFGYY